MTHDGLIVAGDADRKSIWIVDPAERRMHGHIGLRTGDVPGRMTVDGTGRVHVVLRRAGALLTIDPVGVTVLERRSVCPAPRGVAWDARNELVWVSCAGGELVALPSLGPAVRNLRVEDDLRDVIADEGRLWVSRFRSAELLGVDPSTGDVTSRRRPRAREVRNGSEIETMEPNTAWRIRLGPEGEIVMLHQTSARSALPAETRGAYTMDGACTTGVVAPALSGFDRHGGRPWGGGVLPGTALAVDLAIDTTLSRPWYQVARAATESLGTESLGGVLTFISTAILDDCILAGLGDGSLAPAVALAHMPDGRLVTLERDPLRIVVERTVVFEGAGLDEDRGFDIFHATTPSLTACASCHPEAGEDGHTWRFSDLGRRRTPSLLGGLLATAPFHWSGDEDMVGLLGTGIERLGVRLYSVETDAEWVGAWLDAQPLPARSVVDLEAVERGRLSFEDPQSGCATCHSGEALTNNETVDVGTGGAFQVPTLRGVAFRAPYLHHGCATSLEQIVDATCVSTHGSTEHLDAVERADLVVYLRSL